MKWCYLVILLVSSLVVKSQNINTFAGCISVPCSGLGDGHPATAANLTDPAQGVFDKFGNYYFAEPTGHRIRKINGAGIITTVAGNGASGFTGDGMPATTALINEPTAVIVDSIGNFYIADAGNNRIRKVDIITGIITTIVGNGTGAFYGDGGQATAAEIWGVQNICFDKYFNLYIVDAFNHRVRKVNTSGIITTFAGNGSITPLGTGDGGPATSATFALIAGVAADYNGNIYVADYNAGKVRKIDTLSIITTFAGSGVPTNAGDGMAATTAQMAPEWLVFDCSANLIITDRYNERAYAITTSGIFHCIAGIGGSGSFGGDGGPATAASLDPGGASFDPCWNLYIPDIDNVRIRKITYHSPCYLDSIALNTNQNLLSSEIAIYPNPANSLLTIESTTKLKQIIITNVVGQTVYSQACSLTKVEVNIASQPQGVYIVSVSDEAGKTTIEKVIKQ